MGLRTHAAVKNSRFQLGAQVRPGEDPADLRSGCNPATILQGSAGDLEFVPAEVAFETRPALPCHFLAILLVPVDESHRPGERNRCTSRATIDSWRITSLLPRDSRSRARSPTLQKDQANESDRDGSAAVDARVKVASLFVRQRSSSVSHGSGDQFIAMNDGISGRRGQTNRRRLSANSRRPQRVHAPSRRSGSPGAR